MGLRTARLDKKRSKRFCSDCCGGPIPKSFGTGGSLDSSTICDPRRILKLFWQATGTVTYTDPDFCRTGLAQRMELARGQCGQVKATSWCLAMFSSATEEPK